VNTPAERGFQKFMHDRFGGRIAELIGPVPSLNMKDGHPYSYDSATQAQHRNHVHVALDLGHPGVGIGDGHGKFSGDGIGFRGLEDFWVRAGGGAKLAPLMAHIAQAESGGDPTVRNKSGASGLWQILGQPFPVTRSTR
jgi:hypothetical protein